MARDDTMRRVTRIVGSALIGAAVAAIVDLACALARGGALQSVHLLLYLGAGLGLYGAASLMLGAAAAAMAWGLPRPLPRPTLSDILATAAACVVYAGTIFLAHRRLVARINNPVYAATAIALVGLGALAIFAMALRPLRRLAATRPGRVLLATTCLGSLGALGVVLLRVEWRVVRLGGIAGAGILVAAQVAAFLRVRVPRWTALGTAVVSLGALALSAARLPAAAAVVASDTGLALGPLIAVARTITDRDGDGYSAVFAGGDCDDSDKSVHPAARDVPGNGIDENCAGGDARPRVEIARQETQDWPRVENLLLVTIDALRADRVGPDLTPRLHALAERGVRFKRVWAQAPNTPRSFPSVLTSRYPSQVGWAQQFKNYSPILDDNETVFEALGRAGIRNIGLFSHFYFSVERNLSQGFAEWDNSGAGSISESNTDIAAPRIGARVADRLRHLAAAPQRFALWTHFFEPHSRYVDHPEFPVTLKGIPGLVARYDAEIRFVDRHLGNLLDVLMQSGLERNTAIVVFSDHGEAFGEHRHYFHGQALHEEQIRVPLVVAAPGLSPRVLDAPSMLLDLAPTLCELLGVAPPSPFRGRSLLPLARGHALPERPVFAELLPAPSWPHAARALVDRDRKTIDRVSDGVVELYDLAADPAERKNLATSQPEAADAGRAALVRFAESELDGG